MIKHCSWIGLFKLSCLMTKYPVKFKIDVRVIPFCNDFQTNIVKIFLKYDKLLYEQILLKMTNWSEFECPKMHT